MSWKSTPLIFCCQKVQNKNSLYLQRGFTVDETDDDNSPNYVSDNDGDDDPDDSISDDFGEDLREQVASTI